MDRALDDLARLLDESPQASSDDVDDALRVALHWLNDLWEALGRSRYARSIKDDDVAGDPAAETCVAMVFARGEYVHARRDVGSQSWGFREGPFGEGPFGGGWMWPAWPRADKYPTREEWYEAHVARRNLLTPLVAAVAWLREQRELQR